MDLAMQNAPREDTPRQRMRFIVDEVRTTEIRRDTYTRRVQREVYKKLFIERSDDLSIN